MLNQKFKNRKVVFTVLALAGLLRVGIVAIPILGVYLGVNNNSSNTEQAK